MSDWHYKKSSACDLDELLDDLNPQLKDLEGALKNQRPSIMSGYPDAVGAIVSNTAVSHTGSTTETTLKSFDFGRGAISSKGGFRVHAAGTCDGTVAAKTLKLKWGGETIVTLSVALGANRSWAITAEFWNVDSTQDQRYIYYAYDSTTLEGLAVGLIQVDTL